jgi:glyoxylase-like metal-dependent hydrolase (beta-lactamase superfamily II)
MEKHLRQLSFLLTISIIALNSFAQNYDSINIKATKVAGSIYMLEGSGGNIGALIGDDGIILVDDQFAPLSEKIKKSLATLSNKPIKFIINTHFHFDHSDGNKVFGEEGVIIVSHENTRKRLTADQLIAVFKMDQKAYSYHALPKITFSESITFNMNGETVQVFHVKNAHTDGDAIIYFKESNVVHTGDVFVRYGLPFIDQPNGGNVDGMISAADHLLKMINDETKIIPGHGALSNKNDLLTYRKMLQSIRDLVAKGILEGKTLDQIIDTDPTKGHKGIFDKIEFVKIVYNSLKK